MPDVHADEVEPSEDGYPTTDPLSELRSSLSDLKDYADKAYDHEDIKTYDLMTRVIDYTNELIADHATGWALVELLQEHIEAEARTVRNTVVPSIILPGQR